MWSPVFTQSKQNIITISRGTDKLTVVEVPDVSKVTADQISEAAAVQPEFPRYKPDGAGAILAFHTEGGVFVLGGIRNNPALAEKFTKDGKKFPQQINSTIGGRLENPNSPLKDSMLNAIKVKMFLDSDIPEGQKGFEAQQTLKDLFKTIETNKDWEKNICVHTDRWINKDQSEGTMCYLTGIKHIKCSNADLEKIDTALQVVMEIKKSSGVAPKTLSEFKFVHLQPIIKNSLATHLQDEITKASEAYAQYGNIVAVTFNDLAMATLAKNGAFKIKISAQLMLSDKSLEKQITLEH